MLEEAKKYIPQIPEKRSASDAKWREHYFKCKLEAFVNDMARSIKKGLEPPMLVELSAGTKLAKDSSTEVTAHVKVVYKDPQHPFKLSIGVNLKKLSDSLPKIARQFAEGTQPTPPEPPPPPQPA